jgi:hypothetical protein
MTGSSLVTVENQPREPDRMLSANVRVVSPGDPWAYSSVAVPLAAVTLRACYRPAGRAMLVDPMVAIRYE